MSVAPSGLKELFSGRLACSKTLETVGAFAVFSLIALLFYGNGVISSPSTIYAGTGHDSAAIIWSLAWWPYAIGHRLNPFIARVIWTPVGFNLAWATAIPGPSLVLWPVTYMFGPVVAFNLLMILTPALVAQSTFILCRYVSGRFLPAVLGGYIFGFSPYMIGHLLLGQTNITLIVGVPLSLYLVLRRVNQTISQTKFVFGLTAVLTFQFLTSTEIVALMTLFGAFAFALAFAIMPAEKRMDLGGTLLLVGLSYLFLAVLVSPYLYYALARGVPEQMHPIEKCAADLVGYFVPSSMMLIGGRRFAPFDKILTPHVWYAGKGVYTNPALLLMVLLYAYRHWQEPVCRLLMLSGAFIVVCSFGPQLHIFDLSIVDFPWRWIVKLPTLNQALPVRFALYFFLIVSIVASIITSEPQIAGYKRMILALLAIVLMLPNRHYILTVPQKVDTPAFFASPTLEARVEPHDTLLIFPFSIQGTSMLWQAQSDFYFDMVGGYISTYVPPDFRRWEVVAMMLKDEPETGFADQLKPFLSHYNIKGIVVAPEAQAKWRGPLDETGLKAETLGDVLFYRVQPSLGWSGVRDRSLASGQSH